MKMTPTTWLSVAVAAAALGALVYGSTGSPQPDGVPAEVQRAQPAAQANPPGTLPAGHPFAPLSGDNRSLQAELAALRDPVAALADQLAFVRRQLAAAPQRSVAAGDDASHLRSGRASRAEVQRDLNVRDNELQTAFSAEKANPQWANGAVAALRQALAGGATGTLAVRSVECRSRTCRVEIGNGGTADADSLLPSLALRLAGTFGTMAASSVDQGDGTTMVLYFSP